ncbi:MAG: hypothetical protein HY884_07205 [Deltaproteobacteria bacterium]|nr:hypothetical protein [Deltaproteobacteria bacterium]
MKKGFLVAVAVFACLTIRGAGFSFAEQQGDEHKNMEERSVKRAEFKKEMREIEDKQRDEVRAHQDKCESEMQAIKEKYRKEREALKKKHLDQKK